MALITSWSFSRLRQYEACPYSQRLRVEGAPKPPYVENEGTRIHNEAEAFVRGTGPFTPPLKRFQTQFEQERELYAEGKLLVEDEWGFTEHWEPAPWKTAWLRTKLDQFQHAPGEEEAIIRDLKSGKSFGKELEHAQQGQFYSINAFMRFPELQLIEVKFRYLAENKETSKLYARDAKFDRLFERWMTRAERMLNDDELLPKPRKSNCRYCDYSPNEGGSGACPYGVPV